MANVRSIAKRAGVSITTVSRVLNNHPHVSEKARQRVLAVSRELAYSQPVGRRSTNNIAFVYTGEPSPGSPFDQALLEGIQQGMQEHYYDLMVIHAERARLPGETYAQMFLRKGVCGAILHTNALTRAVCERIAEETVPSIVVANRFENPRMNCIDCDARDACREAIAHLIGLGHRQIAFCLNIVDDADHADRLEAYRQALTEHDIPFDERLVMRVPARRDGGVHLMRRLATAPVRPTALFLSDPLPVTGVFSEARKMGIAIPGDLSVVGFDDTDLRLTVVPELTAVCQDAVALGREAFSALVSIVKRDGKGAKPIRKTLQGWLEIHDSTAAPQSDRTR